MNNFVYSEQDLPQVAGGSLKIFAERFKSKSVLIVGLVGDLGAGKTALCKEILKHLGVIGSVVSPTFVLRKDYSGNLEGEEVNIIHIDAYRLEKKEDIKQVLNLQDLTPKTLVLVEWADLAESDYDMVIKIQHLSDGEREIEILSK